MLRRFFSALLWRVHAAAVRRRLRARRRRLFPDQPPGVLAAPSTVALLREMAHADRFEGELSDTVHETRFWPSEADGAGRRLRTWAGPHAAGMRLTVRVLANELARRRTNESE